ncbi:hypothetical protein RCL_jg5016.t2 [Rhizophagus clarus]|uniref:HTH merR-type domain-containing protein n=1 Tax=Rhizophagus clarus TaxID=94130 RepID=A0A8H3LAV7_9GLOM|nr:hypothetical protein RCL_jg5016.t2 [Rhizophagus clarus]
MYGDSDPHLDQAAVLIPIDSTLRDIDVINHLKRSFHGSAFKIDCDLISIITIAKFLVYTTSAEAFTIIHLLFSLKSSSEVALNSLLRYDPHILKSNTRKKYANKIKETYDVSVETLRRWANSGRIAIVRTPGGKRLYSITDIRGIFGDNQTQPAQKGFYCPSRTNTRWRNRRSGDYLKGPIVPAESNEAGELAEDLLAIVTVFVVRHNGLRSAANRRRRRDVAQEIKDIQEGSEETSSRQGTTDSHLSQPAGASETQKMDGNSMMDMQSVSYCVLETPYDIRDEAINDLPGKCFTWGCLICDENKNVILI